MAVYNDSLFTGGRDGVVRKFSLSDLSWQHSYENHIHWVNSIAIDAERELIFSASADSNINIWSLEGVLIHTLPSHIDYLQDICYRGTSILSGGQDGYLLRWDLEKPDATLFNRVHNTSGVSIWSIDADMSGNVVGLGLSTKFPTIIDTRTGSTEVNELKGHKDHIRTIRMSNDHIKCITGSSDQSIKLWDLRMFKCIETYQAHQDSVFTMWVDDDFTRVISGGKDKLGLETDLNTGVTQTLFEDDAPILSILPVRDEIFVSNVTSTVKSYSKGSSSVNRTIPGRSEIRKWKVSDDKRHIIAQDSDRDVYVYDVLLARLKEKLQSADIKEVFKRYTTGMPQTSWFGANIRLGDLMIDLTHSESARLEIDSINYGVKLLSNVFHHWIRAREQIDFGVPLDETVPPLFQSEECTIENSLIIISKDEGTEVVYRKLAKHAGDEAKLDELPGWVKSLIYKTSIPRLLSEQIQFFLNSENTEELPNLSATKLTAVGSIKVSKMTKHIIEHTKYKIPQLEGQDEIKPEDCIEITCKGYLLSKETTLANCKFVIWKQDKEIEFLYRIASEYKPQKGDLE